jgi:hypothetical protein
MEAVAAGRPQLVDLSVIKLIVSRNARITDQRLRQGRGLRIVGLGKAFQGCFEAVCTN